MTDRTLCIQTKSGVGGSGWFAQELAQAVAEGGTKVIYVAPAAVPSAREPRAVGLTRIVVPAERPGAPIVRFSSSLRRVFCGYAGALRARRRTRHYLFSIPDPLVFFLPLQILLRLTGARIGLVVHDVLPHAWTLPPSLQFLQRWALILSYRLANWLAPTTGSGRDDLRRVFGIADANIVVIPHGAYLLPDPGPPPGTCSLLLFGGLRRNKGILEAIEAVQQCQAKGLDVRLRIAGAPDRLDLEYWERCLQQIASAPEGISQEIGFVPDDRVRQLMAGTDAVLLPYRDFNSQSGVAVLSVSCARPVIASSVGGIADLFDLGMAGLRLSTSPSAAEIATAISMFASVDSSEWYARASQSRELVNSKIEWSNVAQRYIRAAFSEQLGSGRVSP